MGRNLTGIINLAFGRDSILIVLFVLISVIEVQSQIPKRSETATFEDGTHLKYYVTQDRPSEIFHHYLTAMGSFNELGYSTELSFSGIIPGKVQYSAAINLKGGSGLGGMLGGVDVYFMKEQMERVQPLAIKQVNTNGFLTRYVVNVPVIKERYFGVHAEGGLDKIVYSNANYVYKVDDDNQFTLAKVSYGIAAIGLTYTSMKGVQIKNGEVDAPFVGFTKLFNAVAEVVYYPNFVVEGEPLQSWNNGTKPLLPEHVATCEIGFKMYAQSQITFGYYSKKQPWCCTGFTWRAGFVKAPHINDYSIIAGSRSKSTLLVGLGLFVLFK